MKRLMKDLGELSGLDIDAAEQRLPEAEPAVQPPGSVADLERDGGARSLGAILRGWLGLDAAGGGRCRDSLEGVPPAARRAEPPRSVGL